MMIKKNETVITDPMSTGISRKLSAFTISFPIPFHPKIYSTNTAPANILENQPERAVITGLSAFFNICFKIMVDVDNPLARAVLT